MKELERFLLSLSSPMTKKYYAININSFMEFKNISTIEDIKTLTIDDIEDWSIYLKDIQNSQNSRRIKLAALSSFYDYLMERNIVNKNIVKPLIKKLKIDTKEQTYLTASEVVSILKIITNYKEYAIIMTMVNTGIRVSELINIKLSDYKEDKLEIINGKGGKDRVVYLNSKTKESIDDYLKVRKESKYDNLFISDQGTPLRTESLNRTIKKLAHNANVNKDISCHSLRRTLATGLYRDGVDLLTIGNILGHNSVQTTQLYVKEQDSKVEAVMKSHNYNIGY
jgi:integrase/recombinase XerD